MAGRGPQTFKKRQKEQQRKEKQEEKRARRLSRVQGKGLPGIESSDEFNTELETDADLDLDHLDVGRPTGQAHEA
jgi:hypothetical protein